MYGKSVECYAVKLSESGFRLQYLQLH